METAIKFNGFQELNANEILLFDGGGAFVGSDFAKAMVGGAVSGGGGAAIATSPIDVPGIAVAAAGGAVIGGAVYLLTFWW